MTTDAAGTIAAIEVVWTLLGAIGLGVSGTGYYDARIDLAELRRAKLNGRRSIVAIGNARNELLRCLIQFLFLVMGAASMTLPARAADPDATPLMIAASAFIVAALIVAELILIGGSIADRRDRVRLLGYPPPPPSAGAPGRLAQIVRRTGYGRSRDGAFPSAARLTEEKRRERVTPTT